MPVAIDFKRIYIVFLTLVIAMVSGLAVGSIYTESLGATTEITSSEDELRASDEELAELIARTKTSAVTDFTAIELYMIAEYNLNNSDKFYKLMTGTVKSAGIVTQKMKSEKLKSDGLLIYNKLSPSSLSAYAICSRVVYDYDNPDNIKIYSNGNFNKSESEYESAEEIIGIFDENDYTSYTQEEYLEIFNTLPTSSVLQYIISYKTCSDDDASEVVANGDGTYSFTISLSGDSLTLAAYYYSYEIKYASGSSKLPTWKSLTMTVTVDSSFNFVKIDYSEKYEVTIPLFGSPTVVDTFTDYFYFGEDVPSVEYVLREE